MRGLRLPSSAALALALALASGGCSFQLGSMFDQSGGEVRGARTTALAPAALRTTVPAESDAALRAAASELFARNEPNASLPWENPTTGARGTVTPIADAYTEAGVTCRDFLASYVKGELEDWLQGEACRAQQGQWEVRRLRPWSRS
jgi:surface antigen